MPKIERGGTTWHCLLSGEIALQEVMDLSQNSLHYSVDTFVAITISLSTSNTHSLVTRISIVNSRHFH